MAKIASITTLAAFGTGLYVLNSMGIDTKGFFTKLLNLKPFADTAKLKLVRFYNIQIAGGITGSLNFSLDVEVTNNTDKDVTASDLQVNIYDEQNQFIGNSQKYASQVTLDANSITTITGINASVSLSKLVPEIGIPALIQVIQTGTLANFKFNKKLKLDVFIKLNGVNINQQIYYDI